MRKLCLSVIALFIFVVNAYAYVTVRYYNGDSKTYVASAECSGSKKTVKFESSRTSSVTIQGSSPCKVTLNGQTFTLKGGERVEIKNGRVKVN